MNSTTGHVGDDGGPAAFRDVVQTTALPDRVEELAEEYDRRVGDRSDFVWRWIYSLFPSFRLSCVAESATALAREQKTILTIFITTLDDLAEHRRDRATFEQARNIPFPEQVVNRDHPGVNQDALSFATVAWQAFEDSLRQAPRYEEFIDVLRYDVRQAINAMDWSNLVSERPGTATLTGTYRYDAHNMVMFPYADVDLMYSPSFDRAEVGTLREALWDVQPLARIGNWVTTWKRELAEGDYSSGVVVAAIQEGVIDPEELTGEVSEEDVARLTARIEAENVEEQFVDEWEDRFTTVRGQYLTTDSVDLGALVDGMQTVFEYHRKSRGLK